MKVRLLKQIHSSFSAVSSADVFLVKDLELPFAPWVGLMFMVGNYEETVKEVCYILEKDRMDCYVEEDKEIYEALAPDSKKTEHRPIDEIINDYLKEGWKKGDKQ